MTRSTLAVLALVCLAVGSADAAEQVFPEFNFALAAPDGEGWQAHEGAKLQPPKLLQAGYVNRGTGRTVPPVRVPVESAGCASDRRGAMG